MCRARIISAVLSACVLLSVPAQVDAQSKKDDPMAHFFAVPASEMFSLMGRAIASKWKVTHTDKDLCLVTFEAATSTWSSGFEATATCDAAEAGSRIQIKARQKGTISMKGREERFAKDVFEEIQKAIPN